MIELLSRTMEGERIEFLTRFGALSLGGGAVIMLLWATTLFPRARYAARWRCWGWILLCLRLSWPFALPSLPHAQVPSPIQVPIPQDTVIYQPVSPAPPAPALPAPGGPAASLPSTAPENAAPKQPEQINPIFSVTLSDILLAGWLAGCAVSLLWGLWQHGRFLHYLRRWAAPVTEGEALDLFQRLGAELGLARLPKLMVCQGLRVPMLCGIWRPCLLLPEQEMDSDALRYALLHELTHLRRRDIWSKSLALWVCVLHWFNPAMWWMARCVERDTELACDDAVLRRLPPKDHAAYGRTILRAVTELKQTDSH